MKRSQIRNAVLAQEQGHVASVGRRRALCVLMCPLSGRNVALGDAWPISRVGTESHTLSPRAIVLSQLSHVTGNAFLMGEVSSQTDTSFQQPLHSTCGHSGVYL